MKIETRPVFLGNSYTVWIGNYRLLFQGTEQEAERIAAEYRRKTNRSGTKKKALTKAVGM
jgi:hypothetical protein